MPQEPRVGDIVHYVTKTGIHLPGIVTRVLDIGSLNLQVFRDSKEDGLNNGTVFESNVPYNEDARPGTWHWTE